jgi:hypothetical protein
MLHITIINEHLCHFIIGVPDTVQPRGLQLIWSTQRAFGDVQEQKGADGSTGRREELNLYMMGA